MQKAHGPLGDDVAHAPVAVEEGDGGPLPDDLDPSHRGLEPGPESVVVSGFEPVDPVGIDALLVRGYEDISAYLGVLLVDSEPFENVDHEALQGREVHPDDVIGQRHLTIIWMPVVDLTCSGLF